MGRQTPGDQKSKDCACVSTDVLSSKSAFCSGLDPKQHEERMEKQTQPLEGDERP